MSDFIYARYGHAIEYLLKAERLSDAVFVLAADKEASCLYAGGCASSLIGLASEQLERKGFMTLVVPEDRAPVRAFLRAVLASEDPLETEWRIRRASADSIVVHVIARRVLDPITDEPVEIVASLRARRATAPEEMPSLFAAGAVAMRH
jgi:PAS domain S-box-containing protein